MPCTVTIQEWTHPATFGKVGALSLTRLTWFQVWCETIMCKSCSHHKHAYDVSTQMHNGIRLLAIPEDFWAINIRHRYLYCGESTDPILATYLLIHLIIHVYCSNFDNSLTTKHSDISNCTGCSITPKVLMIVSRVYYKMWSGVNCLLHPANLFAHSPPFPLDVLLKFLIKGGL